MKGSGSVKGACKIQFVEICDCRAMKSLFCIYVLMFSVALKLLLGCCGIRDLASSVYRMDM